MFNAKERLQVIIEQWSLKQNLCPLSPHLPLRSIPIELLRHAELVLVHVHDDAGTVWVELNAQPLLRDTGLKR